MSLSPTKSYYWSLFLPVYSNFSEQNCLGKLAFNKVSKLNHFSPMNNTVSNKIKYFPQLFALDQQIVLKRKWHYFLFGSVIATKPDIYTQKYKRLYICRGLLQAINLVTTNIWLNFLVKINPYLHQVLMP